MSIDQLAQARRKRIESNGLFSPLIGEIAEALLELDGVAPRKLVINHIARRRGAQRASDALKYELTLAMELHCAQAEREGRLAAFVSGPRTWSLTTDAYDFLSRHISAAAHA